MGTAYRWINALHVVFVVGRFAGLFHLARTEVYRSSMGGSLLALVDDPTRVRLRLRARKLLVFMTGLAVMAVVLGMWLLGLGRGDEGRVGAGKAAVGAAADRLPRLVRRAVHQLRAGAPSRSHAWSGGSMRSRCCF